MEREFLLEIAGVDALEPFDLDFLDVELLAFLHVEDQHGGGAVGLLLDAVVHFGEVEAFLAVQLGDLLDVFGKQAVVEDGARLGAHGRQNVFFFDFVGTVDDHVVDAGLFLDREHEHAALSALFDVGVHVAEVAEIPDSLDFFIERGGINHITLAGGQAHQHHVGVEHLDAADLDVRDGVALDRAAAHLVDKLVDGGKQFDHVLLLDEIGLRPLLSSGIHHAGVDAERVAGLAEAAVHGVVRPGLPGDGTRGRQIELADLLVLEQAQRILCRNDLESLLGQPLLKQLGQLVVQVVEIRPSIDLEGEHSHTDSIRGRLFGRRLSRTVEQQVTQRQRQQREYASLHTVLQIVIRGSARGFPPFHGYG